MINKSFKEYINNKESLVFANSGGHKDQYKDFNNQSNLVYANSGGPKDQHKEFTDEKILIKENLNPKNGPVIINSANRWLRDPEKSDTASDHIPHSLGIPSYHGAPYVFPDYTQEQAKHVKALLDNTKVSDTYYTLMHNYTAGSAQLNSELFHAAKNNKPTPIFVDGMDVGDLDGLIKKHTLPHDMTVYTGTHFKPSEHMGKIVRFPAFTSTSLTPHVSKEFGVYELSGHEYDGTRQSHINILRINLPKGFNHVFTDPGSVYPGQSELILPRNIRMQIGQTPTHIIHGSFYDHFDRHQYSDQHFHIWNARILPN